MACQGDFDVRWLRGSASDLIFAPWLSAIESDGGKVLGGKRVSTIRFKDNSKGAATQATTGNGATGVTGEREGEEGEDNAQVLSGGGAAVVETEAEADASPVCVETTDGEVFEADAVVLAVGITAAKVSNMYYHMYVHTPSCILSISPTSCGKYVFLDVF